MLGSVGSLLQEAFSESKTSYSTSPLIPKKDYCRFLMTMRRMTEEIPAGDILFHSNKLSFFLSWSRALAFGLVISVVDGWNQFSSTRDRKSGSVAAIVVFV